MQYEYDNKKPNTHTHFILITFLIYNIIIHILKHMNQQLSWYGPLGRATKRGLLLGRAELGQFSISRTPLRLCPMDSH